MSTGAVHQRPGLGRRAALLRAAGAAVTDGFFYGASMGARWLPVARPGLHGVEVERDVPYFPGGHPQHHLDVWRPKGAQGPLPVVLYIHGGGFRFMSKDTHWPFGLLFARRGYVVFNIDYRLAPGYRFPAAIEDVARAWRFVVKHAHRWGGDAQRIVLAGESAGANLSTALTLALTQERPEPFAREAYELGVLPRAVIPACGMHQVSNPERYVSNRFIRDRLAEVTDAYLGGVPLGHDRALDLADPLLVLESEARLARPLPPFFVHCGTWDILLEDSQRLAEALARRGTTVQSRWYPRGPHAFHAFVVTPQALRCWKDTFRFLEQHVPR